MLPLSITLFLATALLLGMRHALEPDHLVAVSTLVAEERRLWPAARLGLVWGLGHQLPLMVLGVPVLLLRLQLPATLEHAVDLAVGLILVLLGLRVVWRLRTERVHQHRHEHNGHSHVHFHTHQDSPGHRHHGHLHPMPGRDRQGWITFGVGLVHGFGGSGAIVVLALAAAPTLLSGALYLLTFGAGVCAGMFALTLCLVGPAVAAVSRVRWLHEAARAVAGGTSVALGVYMCWSILPRLLA